MRAFELFEANAYPQLVATLKKNCSRNFKTIVDRDYRLFRGDTGRGMREADADIWWFESDARRQPRKSQTENNLAMVWTAHSDAWAEVPQRSLSNSCTTDFDHAGSFGGRVFLIIPFDNVKAYAYSPFDFNYVQHVPTQGGKHPDLLSRLGYLFNIRDAAQRLLDDEGGEPVVMKFLRKHKKIIGLQMDEYTNIEQLWKFSDFVKDLMALVTSLPPGGLEGAENLADAVHEYMDDFDDAPPVAWFKKHLTPEAMGIKVYTDLDVLPKPGIDGTPEIWFEGQFIGITNKDDNGWIHGATRTPFFNDLKKQILG